MRKNTSVFLYTLTTLSTTHQICVEFSHTKQFCDPSWVSYNLIQFYHYLQVDSVRSNRLRAQSHKIVPMSGANQKSRLLLVLLTDRL